MAHIVLAAIPALTFAGPFPSPIYTQVNPHTSSTVPAYGRMETTSHNMPALVRIDTNGSAASDGEALSRSSTRSSAVSALRRVRVLPSMWQRRSAESSSPAAASSSSVVTPSAGASASRGERQSSIGMSRFFGRLARRGGSQRASEASNADVCVDANSTRLVRHVSFAEQPELADIRRSRSTEGRPPTPRPAAMADDEDFEDDGEMTQDEEDYVALVRERYGYDDDLRSRIEQRRTNDEYYALAFPWC